MAEGPKISVLLDLAVRGFLMGAYQLEDRMARLYMQFDKLRPRVARWGGTLEEAYRASLPFSWQIHAMGRKLGFTAKQTEEALYSYSRLREEIDKSTQTFRMAGAQVGRLTYQTMALGRQVFWLALSYMFNFMAISRVQRMEWARERAQRTIMRLTRDLAELNEELTLAITEYGEASEEVERLQKRRRALVERLEEAYRREAESAIMVIETYIMLISSIVALVYQTVLVLVTLRALKYGWLGLAMAIGTVATVIGVVGYVMAQNARIMEEMQRRIDALKQRYGLLGEAMEEVPMIGVGGRVERHTHIYVHAETRKVGREILRELDRHTRMGRLAVGVR